MEHKIKNLETKLEAWMGDNKQTDDVTLLAFEVQ